MEYRIIGRTGVKVSRLCFGTMSFGGDADEKTARQMFERCREAGVNFFDTANIYTGGRSEEILGKCLAGCRDEIVLCTKVWGAVGPDINARGLSRRHIMLAVEGSLRRLGTDRIDVYFLHNTDNEAAMEEALRALDDLQRQGKILYPAVSNWPAWKTMKAMGVCEQSKWAQLTCLQPMYNLVKRQAEVEILPMARAEGLGVITYSPLGGGLLTGKYGLKTTPEHGRLVSNEMYRKRYGDRQNYEVAERFCAYARKQGYKPAALAVAWVMSHPAVTAPIIGARNVSQLEDSLDAVSIPMTPDLRAEVSALSVAPPPATDRSEAKA